MDHNPSAMTSATDLAARLDLPGVVESLLFVAAEPVTAEALARAAGVPQPELEAALANLGQRLAGRGLRLQRHDGLAQLVTAPEAAGYVERFLRVEREQPLSRAALETLAIIAYRQPVSRAAIEAVRGVNSESAVATLKLRGLVEEVGRGPGPGRPLLLGTTMRFLEHFGLQRPDDLPPLAACPDGEGSSALESQP